MSQANFCRAIGDSLPPYLYPSLLALQVVNSERMTESCDSKVGITGRFLKAEYKRLSLEEEQDQGESFRFRVPLAMQLKKYWVLRMPCSGCVQFQCETAHQ